MIGDKTAESLEDGPMVFREERVSVWEKRVTMLLIVAAVGLVANAASGIRADVKVMASNLGNMSRLVEKHDRKLEDHEKDIRRLDVRLTKTEVKVGVDHD